jgi:hypothetical protein
VTSDSLSEETAFEGKNTSETQEVFLKQFQTFFLTFWQNDRIFRKINLQRKYKGNIFIKMISWVLGFFFGNI